MITLKQFILYITYFLPNFIKKPLKEYYERKKLDTIKKRYKRMRITKEEIISIMDQFCLDSDIFLHSSMSSIGRIEGGVKFISELILEKVNINKNTLLITALPLRGNFKEYLEDGTIFDVRTAPVAMGAVNEYLSFHKNAQRSLHPTHSVIAIGPKSDYYISEHHLGITPFGIYSPYYKLIENNGKILMFGTGLGYLTFIHVIEDILGTYFPINPYLKKHYFMKVIDTAGKTVFVETLCHHPFKAIKTNVYNLLPYFIKYNTINTYKAGDSEISALNAKGVLYAYYRALLDGISVYGKFYLKNDTKRKVLEQIEILKFS